ncbi:transcriptional regulator [Gandjariella thermophila]|uniref:Transcriptional regulator n=1 Tax=Gandjariella thermophila TaxID=1931992 RepID=A0A4D4J7R3_9PSEU|nr:transcriptional regulator [Gandjariella thermophila]GDY31060.1 hypothetical protein GTS_26930 [Gandjariella thermophila]
MVEPNRLLRAARERARSPRLPNAHMSRAELAEAVNAWVRAHTGRAGALDGHYVARLERGVIRWPGNNYRAGFRAVLGVRSDEDIGFRPPRRCVPDQEPPDAASDPAMPDEWTERAAEEWVAAVEAGDGRPIAETTALRLAHAWLVAEPPQRVELRAGRRIGVDLVDGIVRRVASLRRLDDFVAGGDLNPAIERELRATAHLVRTASYTDAVGRRLLAALGELCQLAGWVAADAGLNQRAGRHYLAGVSAAHAAGDAALAGNLVSSLAYHVANTGRARDAVLLAQSALAGSRNTVTATTRALFLERLAWAQAKSGDRAGTDRTLGAVEDAFARRRPDADPEWVYWLNADEIDVMAGRCWTELGVPARAEPPLERALSRYDDRFTREVALYLSWLAEARVQAGDVAGGAAIGLRVAEMSARTASARSNERVRVLLGKLRPYRSVPEVRELWDAADALPRSPAIEP